MNYQEFATLPAWMPVWVEGVKQVTAPLPGWSGETPPPALDTVITVTINRIGPARVIGYFTQAGYLGLRVKPYSPPAWYVKQNGYDATGHVFGAEIDPTPIPEPVLDGPSQAQLAAVARFAKAHGGRWKADLHICWMNGRDEREVDGPLLRQVRNQFGPEWLERCQLEV